MEIRVRYDGAKDQKEQIMEPRGDNKELFSR